MSEQKKWQRFEALVAELQKKLAPHAKVTHNEKIQGRRSNRLRQIDIVIKSNVGQIPVLIIVDCKDYRNPVDVKDVEEFMGLVDDVGANKGIIVSASGFTKTANTRAQDAGIDLYRYVDTESHDWKSYVAIPVLCDFRKINSAYFNFKPVIRIQQDPGTIILYDSEHTIIDTTLNLLFKKWNSNQIPYEPGEYKDIELIDIETFIEIDDRFLSVKVTAGITTEKNLYFGHLPLTEVKGFQDQKTGGVITQGIKTEMLNFVEVEKNWQKVDSEESLAITPVMTFMASDVYPLMKLEGKED